MVKHKNIYILTNDDKFFIFELNLIIKHSEIFKAAIEKDDTFGSFKFPIFLQTISSDYFRTLLKYLNFLETRDKSLIQQISKKFEKTCNFAVFVNFLSSLGIVQDSEVLEVLQTNT